MPSCLIIGPCYRFDLDVRGLNETALGEVRKNVASFIDTDVFDYAVADDVMSFTAKEDIFLDGFAQLVERQYEMWGTCERCPDEVKRLLAKISEAKSIDELVDFADGRGGVFFQNSHAWWYGEYGHQKTCNATIRVFNLYMNVGVFFESFVNFFKSIEKFIKADCPVPAGRFMKVVLDR